MTWFVQATAAAKPRSNDAAIIAVLYAIVLVGFALAQLFTFDKFMGIIADYQLPFSPVFVAALPPVIIAAEIFAIPFLLRMQVSPAFRWLSMMLGWLVALSWLGISGWLVMHSSPVTTVGFTGSLGELTPGWWAVCVSLALGVLAAWASWGLWPGARASATKK